MKIAVCIIATNKYKQFVTPLVESIRKYFLVNHKVEIHVFADEQMDGDFIVHLIPSYGFPEATLYRYKIMTSIAYDTDYIFYLDADMLINDYVGDEILGDIVAVRHPGYYHGGWGSENVDVRSLAFVPKLLRGKYYAGGVQGGSANEYYKAMLVLDSMIDEDERNGVMAEFHDESHWNKYLIGKKIHELDCSFCMCQAWSKRVYHKIHMMPAKILAMEKDFEYFRS